MARKSSTAPRAASSKHRISQSHVKKSNASGYAKRQAQKAAKAASRSDDIYEYAPEKVRRSKVALELDRDEEFDAGNGIGGDGGEDGGDDFEDFRMKARLIGENEDDERIDSDDDEEIDSDAAFDEDDDERFAGFFSTKKKNGVKKKTKVANVRFAEVDLNEDEDEDIEDEKSGEEDSDEEESGPDNEFIDVLDILDGRGEPLDEDEDNSRPSNFTAKSSYSQEDEDEDGPQGFSKEEDDESAEEDSDEEDDGEDDEEDRISISLSDAEEEAAGALDELQNFISSLDTSSTKKRKAGHDESEPTADTSAGPNKRRMLKERTEAGVESEFRTKSAGLSLTDLLAPLGSTSSSSLEKSVKALQSSSGDASSGKRKKPQTLSAPLPQRTQERLDREAAYEKTKEEVDKWSATMKRITEAEHLSFPLQAKPQGRVSNLELAAKFKPSTTLESTISKLLSSANLSTDASVIQTEENILKANALTVEEVAERRRELRRMRELMFRAEVKAKRVKKIKSKVYRRLRRKEKEAAGGGEDLDENEDGEERKMKREMERARERATLKHKNTGKWAKKMMRRDGYGEDEDGEEGVRGGRQEIEEMLARGEKLRRKIQGKDSGEDDSESDDDEEDDGEGSVRAAFDELKALREEDDGAASQEVGKKDKSIFEMKFMKDAMARKQAETDKMVDDFVKEIGEKNVGDSDGEDQVTTQEESNGVVVSRTGGRIVFQPGTGTLERASQTFSVASDNASSSTLKSTTDISPPTPISPAISSSRQKLSRPLLSQPSDPSSFSDPALATSSAAVNPWLALSNSQSGTKVARKNNEVVVDKDSSLMTKSKHKLKKQGQKTEEGKARAKDDAAVEIEMNDVLGAPSVSAQAQAAGAKSNGKGKGKLKEKAKAKAKVGKASAAEDENGEDSEANSEVEEQEKMLQAGKGKKARAVKAFEQRELVARAFAGDNVVKDFEEAKRREIAMDAPQEVDTTLPGWGSWGGTGLRKAPPKPHLVKKVAGIDPTSRADYNKAHVIISEKRDKKAAKYLVKDLPYPYTSQAQFERRMEQPLGPEWNTRVGFQKGTLPKVVKKMGTVIDPLEKLF